MCVTQCTGRYEQGEDRNCVCRYSTSGRTVCLAGCDSAHVRESPWAGCMPRAECARTYMANGEEMCLHREICGDDQYLSDDGQLCREECDAWAKNPETGEKWCLGDCRSQPAEWS